MRSEAALRARLAYMAYDVAGVLAALLAVLTLPLWLWRGHGRGLGQRLGRLPPPAAALRAPVWIHAASVGETRAAAPLVAELRRRHPEQAIIMSATTLTGRAVAESDLRAAVAILLPVDALRIIDGAVRRLRPCCLVIVETEIWPGLLRAAHAVGVPVVVVSGRVSARSLARYRWIAPLIDAALKCVDRFGMQTAPDAERVIRLGAPAERVAVTGTLKSAPVESGAPPLAGLDTRPLLIAASTQPGEEEFVLAACDAVWPAHPAALLLIAPRRPERFDEVDALIHRRAAASERRSRINGAVSAATRVLLLDTVGELSHFLPASTAVFVGGTIAPHGGHNVLEPAAHGKPVAFGPHTQNVADAARALTQHGGGTVVQAPAELGHVWRRLLDDPAAAAAAGAAARTVAESGADVVARTWALLASYLPSSAPSRKSEAPADSRA